MMRDGEKTEELESLRKAMLLSDREDSRNKGQRKLLAFTHSKSAMIASLAKGGLAASYWWSGNFVDAMKECNETIEAYPATPMSVWCSSLLISIYEMLGMKEEMFWAQGRKTKLIKKMILKKSDPTGLAKTIKDMNQEDLFLTLQTMMYSEVSVPEKNLKEELN